jgi:hypothetical protein
MFVIRERLYAHPVFLGRQTVLTHSMNQRLSGYCKISQSTNICQGDLIFYCIGKGIYHLKSSYTGYFFEDRKLKLLSYREYLDNRSMLHFALNDGWNVIEANKLYTSTSLLNIFFFFFRDTSYLSLINPLNAELNPICHFLALLEAHHILHVSRIRVNIRK